MKTACLLLLLTMGVSTHCRTQTSRSGEFKIHSNGLIYSPDDMKVLGSVVDSLNIRFKSCALGRTYKSFAQGKGHYIEFSSKHNNLQEVIKDMKAGGDFDYIAKKHARFIGEKKTNQFLMKVQPRGRRPYYYTGTPIDGYDRAWSLSDSNAVSSGKWNFLFSGKGEYSSTNDLYCWYVPFPFVKKIIPENYARLIQYVDCMVDTNASIMLNRYDSEGHFRREFWNDSLIADYLDKKMGTPIDKCERVYGYYLTDAKVQYAINNLRTDAVFTRMVTDAADECIRKNNGNEFMEELAGEFVSKKKKLEMKRHRSVIGSCSADERPRFHARDIAQLAAETHNWDIFLRAHLNILNDNFERVSDGSWAWQDRKTYLKELEELGLNIVDLMLGLALASEDVSPNHYDGVNWRLGWALSESKDRSAFETRVMGMMRDEQLDEYNRGLLFIMYHSYLNHLDSDEERSGKIKTLKEQRQSFPASLQPAIASMKSERKKNE